MSEQKAKSGYKFVKWLFKKQIKIPESWSDCVFSDSINDLVGGTPLKPGDFVEDGFPVLHKGDIKRNNRIEISEINPYCTLEFAKNYEENVIDDSFLVTTLRDLVPTGPSIGLIAQSDGNYLLAQGAYGFHVDENKIIPNYLIALSNSYLYKQYVFSLSVGSTQIHIRTPLFLQMKFWIPHIPEQQKIASILSNLDETIKNVSHLITQTELYKKGLMKKLFSKGIGHSKFKTINWIYDKEIEIPENWNLEDLKKSIKIISGDYFPFKDFVKDGIPVLKIDNVSYGEIIWENISFLPKSFLNSKEVVTLQKNDIVIALNRPITNNKIKVGRLTSKDVPSILYQRVGKFEIINNDFHDDFLYHLLNGPYFTKIIERILIGSDQPYFKTTELVKQRIFFPPEISEQKQIASILTNIDSKIQKLKLTKSNLKFLKKGLMQNLLTGKIRVKF